MHETFVDKQHNSDSDKQSFILLFILCFVLIMYRYLHTYICDDFRSHQLTGKAFEMVHCFAKKQSKPRCNMTIVNAISYCIKDVLKLEAFPR